MYALLQTIEHKAILHYSVDSLNNYIRTFPSIVENIFTRENFFTAITTTTVSRALCTSWSNLALELPV